MQKTLLVRKRFSRAEREALLAEYCRGEVTQREFAAGAGISVSCLYYWLRKSTERPISTDPPWIELPKGLAAVEVAAVPYKVRFPGGMVLELARGFEPEETALLCRMIGEL